MSGAHAQSAWEVPKTKTRRDKSRARMTIPYTPIGLCKPRIQPIETLYRMVDCHTAQTALENLQCFQSSTNGSPLIKPQQDQAVGRLNGSKKGGAS